jgi:hypothetical protein
MKSLKKNACDYIDLYGNDVYGLEKTLKNIVLKTKSDNSKVA